MSGQGMFQPGNQESGAGVQGTTSLRSEPEFLSTSIILLDLPLLIGLLDISKSNADIYVCVHSNLHCTRARLKKLVFARPGWEDCWDR